MQRGTDGQQQREGFIAIEQPEQHGDAEHAPLPACQAFGIGSDDVGCGHGKHSRVEKCGAKTIAAAPAASTKGTEIHCATLLSDCCFILPSACILNRKSLGVLTSRKSC